MIEGEIAVRVKQMRYEADTVLSVELETLDGSSLPKAEPGAHVDVILSDALRRSYSLTQALDGSVPSCTVAVHNNPKSRGGSSYVHSQLRAGDKLRISQPKNHFPLDAQAETSVLVAGGIGITPILAMIRRLTASGRVWTLHYAARTRAAAAFLTEVTALAAQDPAKGSVTTHFDDEQNGALIDIAGIIASDPDAHFYCCGPEPMLAAYEKAARDVPKGRVHVEYFSASDEAAREGGYDVVLQRSGKTLHIDAGKTILDVFIANNVNVPFACMEGTCGTCETRVLEGRPDHRDMILTDEERLLSETMMVCCSGSKSARLVLDI